VLCQDTKFVSMGARCVSLSYTGALAGVMGFRHRQAQPGQSIAPEDIGEAADALPRVPTLSAPHASCSRSEKPSIQEGMVGDSGGVRTQDKEA
jgi:hypothetical protein